MQRKILAGLIITSILVSIFLIAPIFVVPWAESNGMIPCPAGHSATEAMINGVWHINEGATISEKLVEMNPQGRVVSVQQVCDKTIVNDGYDILSMMMGSHTSVTMDMSVSNATGAVVATDHWCGANAGSGTAGPMTLYGFSVASTTYAHTNGTSTFTLTSATWTLTSTRTIATVCIQGSSRAGASGNDGAQIVDETLLGTAQSVTSGNSVYLVATITP